MLGVAMCFSTCWTYITCMASRVACPPHPENRNATLLHIKHRKETKNPSIFNLLLLHCDMPCKHHSSISLVSSAPLPFRHPIYSSDKSCNTLISALPGLSIQLQGIARYRWLFGPSNAEQWGNGATHCVSFQLILTPPKKEHVMVRFWLSIWCFTLARSSCLVV